MKYLPEAPTNTRGVINGIEYPMRLEYVGVGPHGEHVWAAIWPDGVEPPAWDDFRGLRFDKMPSMTSIMVQTRHQSDAFPHGTQPQ